MKPGNQILLSNLNEEWEEVDTMMLFACFDLLEKFVSQEMHLNDWNFSEKEKSIKREINILLQWWYKRKESENDSADKRQQEEDTQMLIRLIKIRMHLWS